MANTKISAFTAETDVANITGFAAYKTVSGSSTNVRISGSEIESTLNLSNFAVGTLAVDRGGTGQTSYTDGQLLIGNSTANTLAKATLTAGTGVTITNGSGSITITNSAPNQATPAAGSSGQLQYNDGSNGFTATSDMVYTTDQLKVQNTLYLDGNGTNAGIVKLGCEAAGASHYVGLEGPTHGGANSYIIKFPDADPVVGKILKVNSFSSDKAVMEWANDTDTDTSIYAADGSLTGARTVTMDGNNLTFASTTAGQEVKFQQNVRVDGQGYTLQNDQSGITIDWDTGNVQYIALASGSQTFTPSNAESGATYILQLRQPGSGATGTINWNNLVNWPGGTDPTLTATNGAFDVITLIYNGTLSKYFGTVVLDLK